MVREQKTVRYASETFTTRILDDPSQTTITGRLQSGVRLQRTIESGQDGEFNPGIRTTFSELHLVNTDGGLDQLVADFFVDGRDVRFKIGGIEIETEADGYVPTPGLVIVAEIDIIGDQLPDIPPETVPSQLFVSSSTGNDANSGTQIAPWRTVAKVNATTLASNAIVHFRKDDIFRGAGIRPNTGGITYRAYDTGALPIVTGAPDLGQASDWTHELSGRWSASVSQDGGSAPEVLFLNNVNQGFAKSSLALVESGGVGSWRWEAGKLHLKTANATTNPTTTWSNISINQLDTGFNSQGLNSLKIEDLSFTHFRTGLSIPGNTHTLTRVEQHRSTRHGFTISGGNILLNTCVSNDNGIVGQQGCHGFHFNSGAHDCTLSNGSAIGNAEDCIQFQFDCGDRISVIGGNYRNDVENCLDRKSGTGHLIKGAFMRSNSTDHETINMHTDIGSPTGAGSMTIEDCDVENLAGNSALVCKQGNTIISRRNRYVSAIDSDSAVLIRGETDGIPSTFDSQFDRIWNRRTSGGAAGLDLRRTVQVFLDHDTIVGCGLGALNHNIVDDPPPTGFPGNQVRIRIKNSILYSTNSADQPLDLITNGDYTGTDRCLLFRPGVGDQLYIDYAPDTFGTGADFPNYTEGQIDSGLHFSERGFLQNVVTADPLFTDLAAGDFSLQAGSPAFNQASDGTHLGSIQTGGGAVGISYFVRNNGNDTASGIDDANAWATVTRVNSQVFSAGDKVLFQRGSIFRGVGIFPNTSGVTYETYGSGNKPIITGAPDLNQTSDWVDAGNGRWTSSVSTPGVTPDVLWLDNTRAPNKVTDALAVEAGANGTWTWVSPILHIKSSGVNPATQWADISLNRVSKGLDDGGHNGTIVRDLVFKHFHDDGIELSGDNVQMFRVEQHRCSRMGISILSSGNFHLEECVSNQNGRVGQQGCHAFNFNSGAHDGLMLNCDSFAPLEDNICFNASGALGCGDNITVDGGTFTGAAENALDRKSGSGHVIRNATFQNNQSGQQTVNFHITPPGDAGTATIEDCTIEQLASHGALQLIERCTLVSRRNIWISRGASSENCWNLGATSTPGEPTFLNSEYDVVWCENGPAIEMEPGCKIDMNHCTVVASTSAAFVDSAAPRQEGSALRFEPRNSIFFSGSGASQVLNLMSGGDFNAMNFCLLFKSGAVDSSVYITHDVDTGFSGLDWGSYTRAQIDSGTYTTQRGALTNRVTINPLFVDAAAGNFALQTGSPARNAASDGTHIGVWQA